DPATPGYKHILIQPQPGDGFTSVTASHLTPYGKVSSSWQLTDGSFSLNVDIPPNTTATVHLPGAKLADVLESGQPVSGASGITGARQDGDSVVLEAGSGSYRFTFRSIEANKGQLEH